MASTATGVAARVRSTSAALPVSGIVAMSLGAALLGLLHALPQTAGINAVEDTISEYAFTSLHWVFSLAVLLVAVGTGCVFAALTAARVVRTLSVTSVTAALWIAGLLVIVIFEKTNWDVGPSISGTIHRIATIVAFLALPLAVIAGARAAFRHSRWWRLSTQLLAVCSWLCFGIVFAAVGRMAAGGPPWWQSIPLGLVQRGIAFSAVLAVAVLAVGLVVTPRSARETSPQAVDTCPGQ